MAGEVEARPARAVRAGGRETYGSVVASVKVTAAL